MKRKVLIGLAVLMGFLSTVAAVWTAERIWQASRLVGTVEELYLRACEERIQWPPLPSPVSLTDVILPSITAQDDSFESISNWRMLMSSSDVFAESGSELERLGLPLVVVIYEEIVRSEIVVLAGPENSDDLVEVDRYPAPAWSALKGRTLSKYLMDELSGRRIAWHCVIRSSEDATLLAMAEQTLLPAQSSPITLSEPMMMAMSAPEMITDFRIVQDSTNLSVNLPPEFIGATVDLLSSTNLVEGIWSTVLQTNTMSTGTIFLSYADIPDFIYETNVTSGWVDCPSCAMDPGAVCTNQTLVVSTNQVAVGGGVVYYRTSASSLVDSDHDGFGNLIEYEIGTGYLDVDSDDDGLLDGEEVDAGQDPTTANGVPDEFDSPMQSASNGVFVVLPERCWHAQESSLNLETYGAYGE